MAETIAELGRQEQVERCHCGHLLDEHDTEGFEVGTCLICKDMTKCGIYKPASREKRT